MGVKWLTVPRIACEQALRCNLVVGREKEGELTTTSLQFEYLHWKSRCEMLIGRDDISNDIITLGTCFHAFFNVCLHSCWFPLCAHWRKSDRSVDGEPQGNWRQNSNCRDIVASSPNCLLPFPTPLPLSAPISNCHAQLTEDTFSSSSRNVYSWFLREETQGMCLEEYLLKQGRESTTNSTTFSYDANAAIQTKESWEARALNNVPCLLLFIHRAKIELTIRLYFLYIAPWKQSRGMGIHMWTLPNNLLGRIPAQCPNWSTSWSLNLHLFFTALNKIQRNLEIIRDLKIEVFRHFPQTANIKGSHDQGFAIRFVVWGSCLYTYTTLQW